MIEMTKPFCYEQIFAWRVLFALYSGLYTYIKLWTHPHNIRVESDCWNFQQIIETTKQAVMIKDVQWALAVLITGLYIYKIMIKNEPAHDKPTKWHVRPAKTQISLGIRPVWSESLLSAWRKLGSLATNWAHTEDSEQTGRMPRLIWVFIGRTCYFEPGHPPSLSRIFAVRMKKAWVFSYPLSASEDSDQTGRMPRLIWIFAGRTCHFVGFVVRWLINVIHSHLYKSIFTGFTDWHWNRFISTTCVTPIPHITHARKERKLFAWEHLTQAIFFLYHRN